MVKLKTDKFFLLARVIRLLPSSRRENISLSKISDARFRKAQASTRANLALALAKYLHIAPFLSPTVMRVR